MSNPTIELFNGILWERWTKQHDETAGESRIDDDCGLPEGAHPPGRESYRASREERRLGIPLGTFLTIRRLWHDRAPLPIRYGGTVAGTPNMPTNSTRSQGWGIAGESTAPRKL